jgi:hypothetical protein
MISKAPAVVACLALTALTTYAQAPQAGRGGQRQGGPAAAAQPANARVIETMMDNLGMLRGIQRNDSVNRVEMWGENGTKVIGGKPVTLAKWKVSLNFTMNGMRFDYTHDGQRTIEVVSDKYAWNEDTPGGKATPMPATLQERQIQMMLTPIGMAKAAKAAGDAAKVATTGGVTTLTFPAYGGTITATLNKYMTPVKAEARYGTTVLGVTYEQYGDWNDDAKADIYLPKHIVQTQNGMTVLDLTVTHTNTYNPYVIMPVPANVRGGAAGAQSN